ncbi:MAG: CPBP family intramembrane metalloprotease [Clostridiales bacterium]|nr:CPBP family intramembrane metalloprotease [Clostridiales bacterium]
MINTKPLKKPILSYFILTVLVFVVFLGIIGLLMALNVDSRLTDALQIVAAWSSTFAFLILFKRIYPNQPLKSFIKKQFEQKVNPYVILTAIIIQAVIFFVMLFVLNNITMANYKGVLSLNIGAFGLLFLSHILRGPLGEALGWRAFAQNELEKKHSTLKSSLIVGLLWGTWHVPLWFVSGYLGVELLIYSISFMVAIVSLSIIMGFFYKLNKNLFVPIIMHLLFNLLLALIVADLLPALICASICYFTVAVVLVIVNPKKIFRTVR